MKLAFALIAEPYQLMHSASVMFELMGRSDVQSDVYYVHPDTPLLLDRLCDAFERPRIDATLLRPGPVGKAIQSVRLLGLAKPQVLARNEILLSDYDAIVSTEDGIADLFRGKRLADRPAKIVITHGAGGRAVPSFRKMRECDLILAKGPADVDHHLSLDLVEPGQMVAAGYPKFVAARRLAERAPRHFANDHGIVLYNPHKDRRQRSWDLFFKPLLEGFRADRSRNLIVAPHVKFFSRRSKTVRDRLRALGDETILIDPDSERLLDNSYTEAADIYVGDVSSQVFEFLVRPRPCVFINAHRVAWRDDPHYAMWHLGEVVDRPEDLMAAIARAPGIHHRFAQRQQEFAVAAMGDTSDASVLRSADAIVDFLAGIGRT